MAPGGASIFRSVRLLHLSNCTALSVRRRSVLAGRDYRYEDDDVSRMDESCVSHHHVRLSGAGCASRLRESRSTDGHSNRRSQSPRVRLPSISLRLPASYELDEHASSIVDWPGTSAILTQTASKP